jgi:hypothetical protein
MRIFAGEIQGIRNPKAHENTYISRKDAIKLLILASLMMEKSMQQFAIHHYQRIEFSDRCNMHSQIKTAAISLNMCYCVLLQGGETHERDFEITLTTNSTPLCLWRNTNRKARLATTS